ncbi:MAG: hypothetical protein KJN97_17770, partial [Deltaproteobacteria bacterium]|nr:hypothetical protein [Deltaproteobacteria bacterium]
PMTARFNCFYWTLPLVLGSLVFLGCAVTGDDDEADAGAGANDGSGAADGNGGAGGPGGSPGAGGSAGSGGSAGAGGSGDFTITGRILDEDDTTGLSKVLVFVGGVGSDATDANGDYEIEVPMVRRYTVCAVGSIPRRFVSTNCGAEGEVEVTQAGQPAVKDLTIKSGYYMELMDESFQPFDFMPPLGAQIMFDMDYLVWNRSGVGQTRTYIVVGIEGDAQFAHEIPNAGPYDAQTGTGDGTVADVTLTAAAGTIYARLLPLASAMDAMEGYESGFDDSKDTNYVDLGTVTIAQP